MVRGQQGATPQAGVQGLRLWVRVLVQHDNEGWKVVTFTAKPVAQPCTQTRTARLLMSGLKECDGWIVVDRFGVHGPDDADVISDLPVPWQQVADPLT